MMAKIKGLLRRSLVRALVYSGKSTGITDRSILEAYKADPNNSFFISFPRTGSHWLRMLMELYFGRPSLTRVFYYPERTDYLTLHTHDLDLDVERSRVIYLYRDPVDTIYSQLQYHKEDTESRERITYWAALYGRHLDKWLHQETFTSTKTVVRYEEFIVDIAKEFRKICEHFGSEFQLEKIERAAKGISKERVKKKTRHNPQVMDVGQTYESQRRSFRQAQGDVVWQAVLDGREHLQQDF